MTDFQFILCGNPAAAVWLCVGGVARGGGVRGCPEYTPRPPSARMDFIRHLGNSIIEFNTIHPRCQLPSVFSLAMQPTKYARMAAVSEDAQDILQDISVLGLILPNT